MENGHNTAVLDEFEDEGLIPDFFPDSTETDDQDNADDHEPVAFDNDEFDGDDGGEEMSDEPSAETATVGELELTHMPESVQLETATADLPERMILDAYYADYTDPAVQTLVRQQQLAETVPEVIIGKDDRVRVRQTNRYPWAAICSLRITARNGSVWTGTGWLIGKRTVVTAGHCVYIHSAGGWAREIEVIPGRNGTARPFGSVKATSFRSVVGWTKKRRSSHDYGAIILPKDVGSKTGYFGYAAYSDNTLKSMMVNLSGYPGDKRGRLEGTQWWHARRITRVSSRNVYYNIDTMGGQSGAPVWQLKKGKRYGVAIHATGSKTGNGATRITKPVFKNLKRWKSQGQ